LKEKEPPSYPPPIKLGEEKGGGINEKSWSLYILRCQDGSLYTGITNDIQRRLKAHNSGRASRYTSSRRPVELLYQEPCTSRSQALIRECAVKSYSRKEKEDLIKLIDIIAIQENFESLPA